MIVYDPMLSTMKSMKEVLLCVCVFSGGLNLPSITYGLIDELGVSEIF